MAIYISSACIQSKKIKDIIDILRHNGFMNIELSGGSDFCEGMEEELLDLKKRFNLRYICHNYFFLPKEELVVNLASLNNSVYEKSLAYLTKAVKTSETLGAEKFALHAGYFADVSVREFGKRAIFAPLFDKEASIARFCAGFNIIKSLSSKVEIYLENNVYTFENFKRFGHDIPLMVTHYADYLELKKRLDFKLLLDLPHLKISTSSLGLDFNQELKMLMEASDYIHLSETVDTRDQNKHFTADSQIIKQLASCNLKGKTITLEVYEDIKYIKESYEIIQRLTI